MYLQSLVRARFTTASRGDPMPRGDSAMRGASAEASAEHVEAARIVHHYRLDLLGRSAERLKPRNDVLVHVRVSPVAVRLVACLHRNLGARQDAGGIICFQHLDYAAYLLLVGRESATRPHDVLKQLLVSELVLPYKA